MDEETCNEIKELINQGRRLFETSNFNGALELIEKAMQLSEKINYIEGLANSNFIMGMIFFEAGNYQKSIETHLKSLEYFKKMGSEANFMTGSVMYEIGLAQYKKGDFDKALELFQGALKYSASPESNILTYHQMGNIHFDRADYDKALEIYFNIIEIIKKIDKRTPHNIKTEANILHEIGLAYICKNELEKAVNYIDKSLQLKEKIGYTQGVARSYSLLGTIFERYGQPRKALENYNKALQISIKINQPRDISISLEYIGSLLLANKDYKNAVKYFQDSAKIRNKIGDIFGLNVLLSKIGDVYRETGEFNEALKYYNAALDFYKKIHVKEYSASVLHSIADTYYLMGGDHYDTSLDFYQQTLLLYESILGTLKSAKDRIKYRETRISNMPLFMSRIYATNIYKRKKDPSYLKLALGYIEISKAREVISSASSGQEGCNRCPKRLELSDKIESLREKNIAIENKKKSLLQQFTGEELEKQLNNLESELQKNLEELWKIEEIIWKSCEDPQGIIPFDKPDKIIDKFLELKQEPGTIILEFMYLNKEFDIYLIKDSQILFENIQISDEKIFEKAKKMVDYVSMIKELLSDGRLEIAEKVLRKISKQMYQLLIPENFKQIIADAKTLIIIPHRFLHNFPFELIYDGNEYWGLKYNICRTFSLELLRISQSKLLSAKLKKPSIFIVGNPNKDEVLDSKDILGTPFNSEMDGSLPGAEEEVNILLNINNEYHGNSFIILNEEATIDNFLENVNNKNFNLFHFAGHAVFRSEDPNLSCLLFRNGEKLTADEIYNKICFKETPLVVLSSCESGTAKVTGSDELMGLSRALLLVGSPTMILSQWPVFDETTRIVMRIFYKNLYDKKPIAESMKLARTYIKSNMPKDYADLEMLVLGSFTVLGAPGALFK
ncbi:MAG: CHAT domain-containing protein [Candidatus Helarchaeota archaeon]